MGASNDLLGQVIDNRYRVKEYLGEQSVGAAYQAIALHEGNAEVELMYMPRFATQAKGHMRSLEAGFNMRTALNHPNLPKLKSFGLHNDMPYFIRERSEGRTLAGMIASTHREPIDTQVGIHIIYQAVQAFAYAERFQIEHGNLTGTDIIVQQTGRVLVLNMGIAQLFARAGGAMPNFQLKDLRTLGQLFEQLLFMSSLNEDIERIIFKALTPDPEMGYMNFTTLASEMETLRGNVKTTVLPQGEFDNLLDQLMTRQSASRLDVGNSKLVLYFPDSERIERIEVDGEYMIGRHYKDQPVVPDIDLSDDRAYRMGISKLHAMVKVARGEVWITDLGSSNGTFIFGRRLTPNQPLRVNHEDIFRLGRMRVQFLIEDQPKEK